MAQSYDWQNEAIAARGRAGLYAFLSRPFTGPLNETALARLHSPLFTEMLETLASDESGSDLSIGAGQMLEFLKASETDDAGQMVETLEVERARLFRGISPTYGPPPPYEMVWSRGENEASSIQSLKAIYSSAGLEPSDEAPERPDYIGLELEFLRSLTESEARAWENQDETTALDLRRKQADFLRGHVGAWAPAFIAKALELAHTGFFRGHLLALGGFLADEIE